MKTSFLFSACLVSIAFTGLNSCGDEGVKNDEKRINVEDLTKDKPETHGKELKETDIVLEPTINSDWARSGKNIYELKCQSCHRLSEERLVGPGWKGVTQRRKPVWIMNMITNVDMMLETDPEAQKLLEQCMVRMPNQNISKEEARQILEFMRSNDLASGSK